MLSAVSFFIIILSYFKLTKGSHGLLVAKVTDVIHDTEDCIASIDENRYVDLGMLL